MWTGRVRLISSASAASVVLLPPAGRSRHDDEPTRGRREAVDRCGQSKRRKRRDDRGNHAQHHGGRASLTEHARPASPDVRQIEREIYLAVAREPFALRRRQPGRGEQIEISRLWSWAVGSRRFEGAIHSQQWRVAGAQMDIGCVARGGGGEDGCDIHGSRPDRNR